MCVRVRTFVFLFFHRSWFLFNLEIHLRHWGIDSHIWYVKFGGQQKRFALHLLQLKSLLWRFWQQTLPILLQRRVKKWLFLVKLVSFPSDFEVVRCSWTILLMKICNEKTKQKLKLSLLSHHGNGKYKYSTRTTSNIAATFNSFLKFKNSPNIGYSSLET